MGFPVPFSVEWAHLVNRLIWLSSSEILSPRWTCMDVGVLLP